MKKVVIGMSGGVDSSVAAYLLQKQGYEVIGVTMKFFDNDEKNNLTIEDAKSVCQKLNIQHHVLDCREEFKKRVIDNFTCSYATCKTPNPCVECNRFLKFKYLFEESKKYGAEYIATGHYAKIEYDEKYKRNMIKKIDSSKDQTYFLYGIPEELLDHILFPLADYENKSDIREIALQNDIPVAMKKDSQEVCFVPNDDYVSYLENNEEFKKITKENGLNKEGKIIHINGEELGKHTGLYKYTIGQRKGMGISYKTPIYVVELNKEKNELIVGSEENLEKTELRITRTNLLFNESFEDGMAVNVKIRYRSKEAKAKIYHVESSTDIIVRFEEKVIRVTSGQSVAIYDEDILIGGGIID